MSLLDWFRTRATPAPPRLPIAELGPAFDTDEESDPAPRPVDLDGDGIPDSIEGIAIGLEYVDAAGEISVRRTLAARVRSGSGAYVYLDAWCLLRNDLRTFRADRIVKLMLPPAWEAVPDPIKFLSEYVSEPASSRRDVAIIDPNVVCRDGLAVLLFVARSDGNVLPETERAVIRQYVATACARAKIAADPSTLDRLQKYADTLYPSAHSMGQYLSRIERDPGALEILVSCLTALVKADGEYSDQEQKAVSALLKAIGRAQDRIAKETESQNYPAPSADAPLPTQPPTPRHPPGNFIALDVETANPDMASICSIGLVFFRAGEAAQKLSILVNPEDYFDPINVSIHGIRPEDVANAKTLREVLPVIASALESVVVVHHTHFDRVALGRAAREHGFPEFTCRWLDSARVARRAWERYSQRGYGLKNLSEDFGFTFEHHDACEDARAAGLVLLKAMEDTGYDLDDWFDRVKRPLAGRIAQVGNPIGPLAGESVVFTGRLSTMSRADAAKVAAHAGLDVVGGVSHAVSYLVVGDQDLRHLEGETKSAKHRRAEQLISEGATIRIVGESDFRCMIGADELPLAGEDSDKSNAAPPPQIGPHVTMSGQTNEVSRIESVVDAVTLAKREGRLDDACALLSDQIENQEADSRQTGLGVAPWYYEQLAIVHRKQGRRDLELSVLERYDRQTKAPGATPAILKERLNKVRAAIGARK